jgi:hypothetical protein
MDERDDTITLELDREDAPEVIDLIQKKRLALDEEIRKRQAELEALISKATRMGFVLEKLNGGDSSRPHVDETVIGRPKVIPTKEINGFPLKGSVWSKIQYVLRKQIDPLTKNEIIENIALMDVSIAALSGKAKRTFSVSISACLSTKCSLHKLNKLERDGEDFKYFL